MKPICITELASHILDVIKINEIPFIKGSPGIGKSAMYQSIADELNLLFIDFRLSYCDQTSLNGFPIFENNRSSWAPPKLFPLKGDPLPEGKDGWLISFEEINSAPLSIQAIAYKILHDRMVGEFELHPAVRLCANGNLETDGAVVVPLSSALASRMIQFHANINPKNWLKWAEESNLFHPIHLAYLDYRKEMIHNFDPKSADPAYPCPRTHAKVSKLFDSCDKSSRKYSEVRPSIEGSIGEAATVDLYSFINFFDSVIPLDTIIANPMVKPPSDMGIKYATLINVINKISDDEESVVKALSHFEQTGTDGYSIEYPSLFLKKIIRKHRKLFASRHADFNNALEKYKEYLKD